MCWFIILGISEGLHFLITAVFFQSMFNYLYSKRGECRRELYLAVLLSEVLMIILSYVKLNQIGLSLYT